MVNDFQAPDSRKKGYPRSRVELRRFMSIPVFISGRKVAVVGVGNKAAEYTDGDVGSWGNEAARRRHDDPVR